MIIGLLGFGTIGAGVYELARQQQNLQVRYVLDIREIGVPELTHQISDILEDPEVDTVVEVLGGLHPSYEFVSAALRAGKNVVTANKYLVATYFEELTALARKTGAAFRCTAAVGGGIGWLTALERVKRVEPVLSIEGIMNGTTNYILSNMARNGLDFKTALSEAQALGYAEADPSADIDGLDILHKLLLSANVAFDVALPVEEIPVFGIRNLTDDDVWSFKSRGLVCKMLGVARREGAQVAAYVQPTLLPEQSLTAAVPSNFNLISYETEYSGRMSFYGQGAGRYPTAANVVQDCLDLQNGVKNFYTIEGARASLNNELAHYRYYLRTKSSRSREVREETLGDGVLTKPLSVAQMSALMKTLKGEDGQAFAAAVQAWE